MSFKKTALKALHWSGITACVRQIYEGNGVILLFHRVLPSDSLSVIDGNRGMEVSISAFQTVIDYFNKHDFTWIGLDDLALAMQNRRLPRKFVAVTFDDGYRDNLEHAAPILNREKIPFTIFLTTGFLSGEKIPWWYALEWCIVHERSLDLSAFDINQTIDFKGIDRHKRNQLFWQLRNILKIKVAESGEEKIASFFTRLGCPVHKLSRELFLAPADLAQFSATLTTFGAHSITHRNFSSLTETEVEHEMKVSKETIESFMQRQIDFFAFPYGDKMSCGERESILATRLGYKLSFSTRHGWIRKGHLEHQNFLPRINIGGDCVTQSDLEIHLSGVKQAARLSSPGLVVF